ncbi:MAG: AAA family ATPase [Acidobacteria bacterium]|nr:AAA family ATPase [Acidobacteriota bacterium]
MAKKIIGKADVAIAGLVQRLNLNDWLYQGRDYLQADDTCPFCQQPTITANFRNQLEEYFDEAFANDTNYVKSLTEEYDRLTAELNDILEEIETDEKENADAKLDVVKFSASLKTLISQLNTNKALLSSKIKEASRSIELQSSLVEFDGVKTQIASANSQITKHNALVANYTKEKSLLISQIWKFLIEDYRTKIEVFKRKKAGIQTGIDRLIGERDALVQKYKNLEEEIREKNKNVTSVQLSVDEINRTLKSFGFTNFEIVPSKSEKNQYQIQREDGSIAHTTLSEGEITFITFLYFLQLCKGSTSAETITQERILVIDDPISSLDSNVLFVVSTLLKEIIKQIKVGTGNIRQIILLTHNVYFHKEASFINGREIRNGDTHFWILRRNKTERQYSLSDRIIR